MLSSFPIAAGVGCVLGFLSGLGVGGGSLLMLWLTLALDIPQETARGINLLFFIPSALIASAFHFKKGRLDIKKLLPGILFGCASAALFSLIGRQIEVSALKKVFGGLLILTGLRELFYRPKRP